MQYRRSNTEGSSYFFTVNLAGRNKTTLVDHVDLLREVVERVCSRHPFIIDAIVILPEHLHALWTLPEGDKDYPKRWSLIKSGVSRTLPLTESRSVSRIKKGERGIWQRRYWEHLVRDERDFERHVDYIHYNPVKHGYVGRADDWPFSRIQRAIRNGLPEEG
jgi:putative transposase